MGQEFSLPGLRPLARAAVAVLVLAAEQALAQTCAAGAQDGCFASKKASAGCIPGGGGKLRCRGALTGGAVTTVAGSGAASFKDATGASAQFNNPSCVVVSPDGVFALVGDSSNNRVRKIDLQTQAVTTLAGSGARGSKDGTGTSAQFKDLKGVAISPDGVFAVVATSDDHRIRHIVVNTRAVTTLAGSGTGGFKDATGASAQFHYPHGVAISPDGAFVLVADFLTRRIRHIVIKTKVVTTLAGSGTSGSKDATGAAAQFKGPLGVTVSPDGVFALVADSGNNCIRRIVIKTQAVTTLAGAGDAQAGFKNANGGLARFNYPQGVAYSPDGVFALVADKNNQRVRRIDIKTQAVTTLAGDGQEGFKEATGESARFKRPRDVAVSPDGVFALVADTLNHRIRRVSLDAPRGNRAGFTLNVSTDVVSRCPVGSTVPQSSAKTSCDRCPNGKTTNSSSASDATCSSNCTSQSGCGQGDTNVLCVGGSLDKLKCKAGKNQAGYVVGSGGVVSPCGSGTNLAANQARTTCVHNTCKCDYGVAKSGANCTSDRASMCAKCGPDAVLNSGQTKCEPAPPPPPPATEKCKDRDTGELGPCPPPAAAPPAGSAAASTKAIMVLHALAILLSLMCVSL